MSTAAVDTLSAGSGDERVRNLAVLTTLGVDLPKTAKILDFGCGAGDILKALRCAWIRQRSRLRRRGWPHYVWALIGITSRSGRCWI